MKSDILAIDVGATKIEAALVTGSGQIRQRSVTPTPLSTDEADVLAALLSVAEEAAGGGGVTSVGVGCPGPLSRDRELVSPVNIPAWRDFPLRAALQDHWQLPVDVENDGNAFALGQAQFGVARGVESFVGMIISTGVGGGIVLDGNLLRGSTGNAGELGHILVASGTHLCPCGHVGCLATEASGRLLSQRGIDPRRLGPTEIVRVGAAVGDALAQLASILDLELAVIGGSIGLGLGEPLRAEAERTALEHLRAMSPRQFRVALASPPADAAILAAAGVANG